MKRRMTRTSTNWEISEGTNVSTFLRYILMHMLFIIFFEEDYLIDHFIMF